MVILNKIALRKVSNGMEQPCLGLQLRTAPGLGIRGKPGPGDSFLRLAVS